VVSCGCNFEKSKCRNKFPDCPGFSDPGLNFGNGKCLFRSAHVRYFMFSSVEISRCALFIFSAFYNDMHFHYGTWRSCAMKFSMLRLEMHLTQNLFETLFYRLSYSRRRHCVPFRRRLGKVSIRFDSL